MKICLCESWAALCRCWETSYISAHLQDGSAEKIGDFVLLYVVQEIIIEIALKRPQMLSPKWSALWKMTIRHKNAWERRCFWNQCKILSVIEQIHHLTTKIPTDLDEALQYISSFDRCCSPCDRIDGYRDMEFLSACPILLCRKETAVLVVEKAIMKMQKKTQRHTKGLTTQFIDFLYALEHQYINYTLKWYLLRCFYPGVRIFPNKFWKRCERLFQENVCPDTKTAHYFSKTRQKKFL